MSTLHDDLISKNSFPGVPSEAGPENPCHPSENSTLTSGIAQSENQDSAVIAEVAAELGSRSGPFTGQLGALREVLDADEKAENILKPDPRIAHLETEVGALKDAAVRLTKKLDAWRELGRQAGSDMEYWFKLSGGEYPRRRCGEIKKAIEDCERL